MSWSQRIYLLWTKSVQRAASLNNKGLTYTSILQVDRERWGVHDGVALVASGPSDRVWLENAAQVNIDFKLKMDFKHGCVRIWKDVPSTMLAKWWRRESRWSAALELTRRTKCLTIKGKSRGLPTVSQNQGKDVLQSYFILNKFELLCWILSWDRKSVLMIGMFSTSLKIWISIFRDYFEKRFQNPRVAFEAMLPDCCILVNLVGKRQFWELGPKKGVRVP